MSDALQTVEAAVDTVAAKRDEVDENVMGLDGADEWRQALTLIHATAKEWYSLRNRMMDAYLNEVRRKETR